MPDKADKKIRVLQFPMNNTRDGVTRYVLENWRFINKARFTFDFVTLAPKLDFEDALNAQGCKVFHISCRSTEDERRFRWEMQEILAHGYDAAHLHTSWWSGLVLDEVARAHGIPKVIIHAHNSGIPVADTPLDEQVRLHEYNKKIFSADWRKFATHLCTCSQTAADWLFGKEIPRQDIAILKNSIDTDKFVYNEAVRDSYRKKLRLEDSFVIGHVGRFNHQKNHEFIIRTFSRLVQKNPEAHLLLIGDGPLLARVKEQARELGIADKVSFLGLRDDIAELMQAIDFFILPSHFEGLGIVLIEAQAVGLPCLASNAVPQESKATPNLHFLPLDEKIWCDFILSTHCKERKSCTEYLENAGYSLKHSVKILEKFYEGVL